MKRRTLQRCCLSLMACVLLLAQMPAVHAMPEGGQVASAQLPADPPCHGQDGPAADAEHERRDSGGCCDGMHCDGHCAHPAWGLALHVMPAAVFHQLPVPAAVALPLPVLHQPELFRPPI